MRYNGRNGRMDENMSEDAYTQRFNITLIFERILSFDDKII